MGTIEQSISREVGKTVDAKFSNFLELFKKMVDAPKNEELERWVSYAQGGKILGVSELTMKRYVKQERFEVRYLCGKASVRFRLSDVYSLLEGSVRDTKMIEEKLKATEAMRNGRPKKKKTIQ